MGNLLPIEEHHKSIYTSPYCLKNCCKPVRYMKGGKEVVQVPIIPKGYSYCPICGRRVR